MTTPAARSRLLPYSLLVITTLFWSGNWVVGRAVHADVPPVALSFWRWVIAFVALLPFAFGALRRDWAILRANWPILTLFGILGTSLYNILAYGALQFTTATNGSLIQALTPLVIMLFARIALGDALTRRQVLGVAISMTGALAIIGRGEIATFLQLELNRGDLLVLASVMVWASYTVALRWRPPGLDPLSFLAALMGLGILTCLPPYIWEIASGRLINPTPGAIAGMLYTGIFPALLAYIFWNYAVARVGPGIAGLFFYLITVFGPLMSVLFLGETLHAYHVAGMALVFSGIYLSSKGG